MDDTLAEKGAVDASKAARWKREFSGASNVTEIFCLLSGQGKDYNALPAMINLLERIETLTIPHEKRRRIYNKCCYEIAEIVRSGHTPLTGEMVDALVKIAKETKTPTVAIGIYCIFGAIGERRAVGALVEAVKEGYRLDEGRNEAVKRGIENGPKVSWRYLDGARDVTFDVETHADERNDVACIALIALRDIRDGSALETLVEMQNGMFGTDLYLGIAIQKILMGTGYRQFMDELIGDESSIDERNKVARRFLNIKLGTLDGRPFNWQNPAIRERADMLATIETLDCLSEGNSLMPPETTSKG